MTVLTHTDLDPVLHAHRAELGRHCRRLLGSAADADDAVQETLVKAWRSFDGFEGRGSVRSWLYTIATRVCVDMLRAGARRPAPVHLATDEALPMRAVAAASDDPADLVARRQAAQLAFAAALGGLPPRQRAVLVLREVLRWDVVAIAGMLGCSVAAVNSALQRARASLPARLGAEVPGIRPAAPAVVTRYVDAVERRDAGALLSLVRNDAA